MVKKKEFDGLILAVSKEFDKVYKYIQGLFKEIRDTQGDIPATVELEKLGDDYWHFLVKSVEGEQECSVKGNLSMILHMGVCFRKIYDWDEKKDSEGEKESDSDLVGGVHSKRKPKDISDNSKPDETETFTPEQFIHNKGIVNGTPEKKDYYEECKKRKVVPTRLHYEDYYKDSGGEKEDWSKDVLDTSTPVAIKSLVKDASGKSDSKPSEPCKHGNKKIECRICNVITEKPPEHKRTTKFPKDGKNYTFSEPREDDKTCTECGIVLPKEYQRFKGSFRCYGCEIKKNPDVEPPLYKCLKCETITNSLDFAQDICGNNVCPKCGHGTFTLPSEEKKESYLFPANWRGDWNKDSGKTEKKCTVIDCQLIGTDKQCKICSQWDSGGENEPSECHSERMGVDSSEDNSKQPEVIYTDCVGFCGFCEVKDTCENPKRLKQREDDKENMMFGVFSKETHVLVKREKIEFWRKKLLNKTDEVLKSMREVLGIE